MTNTYAYIKSNGGVNKASYYPYKSGSTNAKGTCKYSGLPANIGAKIIGYVNVKQYDELALKTAVANVGPVAIAMDAGNPSFPVYKSGIYNEPACFKTNLNHGVLIVGYGTNAQNQDYWIVKNSWYVSI